MRSKDIKNLRHCNLRRKAFKWEMERLMQAPIQAPMQAQPMLRDSSKTVKISIMVIAQEWDIQVVVVLGRQQPQRQIISSNNGRHSRVKELDSAES